MADRKKIALVGLRALESLGIKEILQGCSEAEAVTFNGYAEFCPLAEGMDAYVVKVDIFVANLDYFLPRKQKTIVVMNVSHPSGGEAGCMKEGGLICIYPDADEAEAEGKVKSLLAVLDTDRDCPGELSTREKDVLRLIAAGRINKEIADELCISINTVITHRKNISSKLGIKSASGLSLYAMMNGLL